MNREQKEGRFENLKGRFRQAVGTVSGDKEKEAQGAGERAEGSIKKALGDLKQRFAKKMEH